MTRSFLILLVLLVSVTGCVSGEAETLRTAEQALPRPAGTLHNGPAFRFTKITDDIYHARGTGALNVGTNSVVIINEADVMLVDSHISPAAAWVLLDELKTITQKPVKYVVNTHFHFDHAHGNQVFPPDVEVIGHEFTWQKLAGKPLEERSYVSGSRSDRRSQAPDRVRVRFSSTQWFGGTASCAGKLLDRPPGTGADAP